MKSIGYIVSTVSVILLGIVAWQGASAHPELKPYLIAGMATSIIGMFLRFLSHEKDKKERNLKAAHPATG